MNTFVRYLIRHKSVSFITVESVPVGVTLRVCQLAILAYACFQVFLQKQYFAFEKPQGFSNSWGDGFNSNLSEEPQFCNNPAFDFLWSSTWRYENNGCGSFVSGDVVNKLPSGGLYVQTYVQQTLTQKNWCTYSGKACNETQTVSNNLFVVGVDEMSIGMNVASHTSFRSDKDVAVDLLAHGDNTVLASYPAGQALSIPLSLILQASGIGSLDSKNKDAYEITSSGFASYRMTGMLLLFEFEFSNTHTMHGKEVIAKLRIKDAKVGWAGSGATSDHLALDMNDDGSSFNATIKDLYSYGIKIQVLYGGQIGQPSVDSAISALVQYSVILTIASLMADFVAEYLDPTIKERFREKKKEAINTLTKPKGTVVKPAPMAE